MARGITNTDINAIVNGGTTPIVPINIDGTSANDTLTGNAQNNIIIGG